MDVDMNLARFDGLIVEFVKFIESLPDNPPLLTLSFLFLLLFVIVFIYLVTIYWSSLRG